jgi:hypothetical protein
MESLVFMVLATFPMGYSVLERNLGSVSKDKLRKVDLFERELPISFSDWKDSIGSCHRFSHFQCEKGRGRGLRGSFLLLFLVLCFEFFIFLSLWGSDECRLKYLFTQISEPAPAGSVHCKGRVFSFLYSGETKVRDSGQRTGGGSRSDTLSFFDFRIWIGGVGDIFWHDPCGSVLPKGKAVGLLQVLVFLVTLDRGDEDWKVFWVAE